MRWRLGAEYPFDVFDGLVHSPPRAMHPNELRAD